MAETATATATNPTEAASSSQESTATETGKTLVTAVEDKQEQASTETKQEVSTETKTEATKAEEAKTETKTEAKTEGAPEKYEFKDADKVDPKVLEAFSESAKEANLSQDAAQKLFEKVVPTIAARQAEQVEQVKKGWVESSKSDKEFGGDHLKENLGIAKKALDTFGSKELSKFLDDTGLGSHPEVIRMLYRTGKAISEDKIVTGAPASKSPASITDVLYDQTPRKE